jgi:hypothetical protein
MPYTAADVAVVVTERTGEAGVVGLGTGLAAQTAPGFEVINAVDTGGAARAANAAWRAAVRPLLLHVDFHNRHGDEAVSAIGRVVARPGSSELARWMVNRGTRLDAAGNDASPDTEVSHLAFDIRNLSLPAALLEAVGGFDEAFGFTYGDADCGWRLAQSGVRLLALPSAVVHVDGPATWDQAAAHLDLWAWGEHQMAAKHGWFTPVLAQRMHDADADEDREYVRRLGPRFLESWRLGRDLEELRRYLGPRFDWDALFRHHAAVDEEEAAAPDEATFYRTSDAYLYDLTVFALSRTKAPYLADLRRIVAPGARILDYGCGIGADGLVLLDAGYEMAFADFDNPSTRYLRWRLADRGLEAPVHNVDEHVPGGFDLAYSFDVIEHVEDPIAFLQRLESRAAIVMVNLLEPDPDDTHLHRPLPVASLLDRAQERGLLLYRRYYGRSHLMAYCSNGSSGAFRRLRSRVERSVGPHLKRRPPAGSAD